MLNADMVEAPGTGAAQFHICPNLLLAQFETVEFDFIDHPFKIPRINDLAISCSHISADMEVTVVGIERPLPVVGIAILSTVDIDPLSWRT